MRDFVGIPYASLPEVRDPDFTYRLKNMFAQLDEFGRDSSRGFALIQQGFSPIAGGTTPLVDLSGFYFLPGRDNIQVATGGSQGDFIRFEPPPFTVTGCTTSGTAVVTTSTHFLPAGGPSVVPGMIVTGVNVADGTIVVDSTYPTDLSITLSNTVAAGTTSLTFHAALDIDTISTETATDINFTPQGAIRFTTHTGGPLRIIGGTESVAANIATAPRVYLEVGAVTAGAAVGGDFQIGGPTHGELSHLFLESQFAYIDRRAGATTGICLGINQNPNEYGAGLGPNPLTGVLVKERNGEGLTIIPTSGGSGRLLGLRTVNSATSPNKTLGELIFGFGADGKFTGYAGASNSTLGAYQTFADDSWTLSTLSDSLVQIQVGRVSAWADSLALANSFLTRLGDLKNAHRAMLLTSSGNGLFTRFGILSAFTTIANGTASTIPIGTSLLHLDLTAAAGTTKGFLINAKSTQDSAASLMDIVSAVSGSQTFQVDYKGLLQASLKTTGFIVDSADPTKKVAFSNSANTTATTRTLTVPNASGTLALLSLAQTWTALQTFNEAADTVKVVVKGHSTQIAVLQQWQSSAGAVLASVDPAGGILCAAVTLGLNGVIVYDDGAGNDMTIDFTLVSGSTTVQMPATGGQVVTTGATQSLGSKTLVQTCVIRLNGSLTGVTFQGTGATTKQMQIDLNGITAGTTRVLAVPDLTGKFVLVGDDPPAVASGALGKEDLTAQAADIASVNLSNTPPAGFYQVNAYLVCTAADAGAGTATLTIGWTDVLGATTNATITKVLTATGRSSGVIPIQVSSGNITYTITGGGTYGTARYALYLRVVALG